MTISFDKFFKGRDKHKVGRVTWYPTTRRRLFEFDQICRQLNPGSSSDRVVALYSTGGKLTRTKGLDHGREGDNDQKVSFC